MVARLVTSDASSTGGSPPVRPPRPQIDLSGLQIEIEKGCLYISVPADGTKAALDKVVTISVKMREYGIDHETYDREDPNDRKRRVIDTVIIRLG